MTKKTAPKLSGFGKLDDINPKNLLSKFGGHGNKIDTKIVDHDLDHELEPMADLELNPSNPKSINVNRKARNVFKNIESLESSSNNMFKNKDEDLPILDGIKTLKKKDER